MLIEQTRHENMSMLAVSKTAHKAIVKTYSQADLENARNAGRAEALTEFQTILSDNKKYKHLEALFPNRG